MKKMYLMAFAIIGVTVFTSCGDDNEEEAKASIVGEWTYADSEIDSKINGAPVLDYLVDTLGMDEETAEMFAALYTSGFDPELEGSTITFNADNTYVSKSTGEAPENGTYTISSDGKTITTDANTEDEQTLTIESLTTSS